MIKTKYYSDVTKKFYDVSEDAEKAEAKEAEKNALELKKKEEKTAKAKEIEKAYQDYIDAYKHYLELRTAFIDDYGSFHMTYRNNVPKVFDSWVTDSIDWLFTR